MFEQEPTVLRVGAYSVDPARFAAILGRHPGAGPMLGVDAGAADAGAADAGASDVEAAGMEAAEPQAATDAAATDAAAGADAEPAGAGAAPHEQATEWAVKQAVLRALGAPIRLRARWPEMEVSREPDGRWRVTSRGPVRQFHEAHTLGHVDVTVSRDGGRITAFAVLTRDVATTPEPPPGPADLPDRVHVAGVNGPTDPDEY